MKRGSELISVSEFSIFGKHQTKWEWNKSENNNKNFLRNWGRKGAGGKGDLREGRANQLDEGFCDVFVLQWWRHGESIDVTTPAMREQSMRSVERSKYQQQSSSSSKAAAARDKTSLFCFIKWTWLTFQLFHEAVDLFHAWCSVVSLIIHYSL